MGEMKFKVADGGTLRFYPMVEYVIGEGVPEVPQAADEPAADEPAADAEHTPGFEALIAISGLLAVAYFVLRKK